MGKISNSGEGFKPGELILVIGNAPGKRSDNTCSMCGRQLDQPDEPLSKDCGGDCWGCVRECER